MKAFFTFILSLSVCAALAQNHLITGSVTDTQGNSIQGATVSLRELSKSVLTDNDGSFVIDLNGDKNEVITIRIYNAQSKIVYEAENIKVDKVYNQTIHLNAEKGIYLIRIEGKELLVNEKMIINK